jgi:hypothetical protein
MASGSHWISDYYDGRIHGGAEMTIDTDGSIVVTMSYARASTCRPGHKLALKFACVRDETICYARARHRGQVIFWALPLDGTLVGKYVAMDPIDYGKITLSPAEIEIIRKGVPLSSEPLTEPSEFKSVHAISPPSLCSLL